MNEEATYSEIGSSIVRAVSVIGRRNQLLYTDDFGADFSDALLFEQAIFASLDHISDRFPDRSIDPSSTSKGGNAPFDPFLGLILPFQGFKTLAYVTITGVKLILVTKDYPLREDKMRDVFKQLHEAVVGASCNPFKALDFDANPENAHVSKNLKSKIAKIVTENNIMAV